MRVNLEMDGFSVREAGSADEGLAALEAEPPDLILLDVMMPKVDGWEMLQRVRERHGVDSIQVIMFSGQVDEDAADQAEAGGAQAFLGKPFNPQDLVARTKDLLAKLSAIALGQRLTSEASGGAARATITEQRCDRRLIQSPIPRLAGWNPPGSRSRG